MGDLLTYPTKRKRPYQRGNGESWRKDPPLNVVDLHPPPAPRQLQPFPPSAYLFRAMLQALEVALPQARLRWNTYRALNEMGETFAEDRDVRLVIGAAFELLTSNRGRW
ncbi:MAG: hypothetical protein JO303_16020 [Caulobacteraceae bacterium]|nr:hypothetical protein [Caulobacteraceae bacterium]